MPHRTGCHSSAVAEADGPVHQGPRDDAGTLPRRADRDVYLPVATDSKLLTV